MWIRWDELRARRKEQLVDLMERGELKRLSRTRPRDPEEEQVLSLLVHLRWKRWIESGKVVIPQSAALATAAGLGRQHCREIANKLYHHAEAYT